MSFGLGLGNVTVATNNTLRGDISFNGENITMNGPVGTDKLTVGEIKIARRPHKFVQYRLRVVDLRAKDQPTHDRILLEVTDTIEIVPDRADRDAMLLKNAAAIQAIPEHEELSVEIEYLKQWTIVQ